MILSLYMNDMLMIENDSQMVKCFSTTIEKMFKMLDLGKMFYFLGIELYQVEGSIFLS